MKRIYHVREYFVSPVLGPFFAGQFFPEYLLKHLTHSERKKLDVKELSSDFSVFGYGLIFYSQEFEFPEGLEPEETYDEKVCRALNEMNNCCPPGNNKTFLNKDKNGETN